MPEPFGTLLDIIDELNGRGIHYEISGKCRPRSLMITASSPRRLWEIEVFEDGAVEVEVYEATNIEGPEALQRLYDLYDE